jgi:hypothetical protein
MRSGDNGGGDELDRTPSRAGAARAPCRPCPNWRAGRYAPGLTLTLQRSGRAIMDGSRSATRADGTGGGRGPIEQR